MPTYLEPDQVYKMTDETITELNSTIKEHDMRVLNFFDNEKKFLGLCICDNDKANELKEKHLKEGVGVAVGDDIIKPTITGIN